MGLAKDNLDKKLVKDIKTDQNQMECTNKHSNERPHKRKSTMILSSFSDITYSSSDEDENTIKKKKIQSHEDTNRVLRSNKMVCTARCSEKNKNLNQDNDSSLLVDNMETENFKAECKKESKEYLSSESIPLCPKKVPYNVRRSIIKRREHVINMSSSSPLAHSSNEKQNAITLISKNKSSNLTDENILIELENDNANDNVKTIFESTETKPLPKKGFSSRINNVYVSLEKLQLEKRKRHEIEKEEAEKREADQKKKKEEFYKKQLEGRQRREKQREEEEKHKEGKTKKWNTIVDVKSLKKTNKDEERLQDLNRQNKCTTSVEDNMSEVIISFSFFLVIYTGKMLYICASILFRMIVLLYLEK